MSSSISTLLALYNENAPLAEAYTLPAAWYLSESIAQTERERVFHRHWIAVGRAGQAAEPGQFFTVDLAGEPIVVIRGAAGELRAFYNVCRHHAAAVATAPGGVVEHLRCPYHGWTYGLDGSLKGAPEFTGTCNFDRSANGLVPVLVATWEGFIFVNLDPQAAPLSSSLGDLAGRIAPLSLAKLGYFSSRSYTLACNWKVYVDNYLDGGYHVPHLHKALNSALDYSNYTIENGERFCLQSSPMVKSKNPSVASTRRGHRALYYWLYPNFMMNIYDGVMDTNLVLPLGPEKCIVYFDYFFSDVGAARRKHNSESVAVSDQVQMEDAGICESVQRGLRSKAYGAGRLSLRRESGEHLFHRLLAHDLKSPV